MKWLKPHNIRRIGQRHDRKHGGTWTHALAGHPVLAPAPRLRMPDPAEVEAYLASHR